MTIVSAREFRANQGKFLTQAKRGHSVVLTSRYGNFKISPVEEEDTLTTRICEGLRQVKSMIDGEIPTKSARNFLDEL